ncbi:YolD-like family protein [Lacrimispora sp. JR3]|uniref:YolD-like family protein n=1 Tax=Lacrimispora sinapis TaxID=3111456 RepID=UPI0037478881
MESRRRKMDRKSRAKQFMPFDALKGFQEALEERGRIMVPKRDLAEDKTEELDWKLRQLGKEDMVTVEYFQDREYVRMTGRVTRIDNTSRTLEIANRRIPYNDISDLKCDMGWIKNKVSECEIER